MSSLIATIGPPAVLTIRNSIVSPMGSGGAGGAVIPAMAVFVKPNGTLGYGGSLPVGGAWVTVPL